MFLVMYMRRDFMQRLSVVLHGTLGSYLLHALQEGCADAVACLIAPRAKACVAGFFRYLLPRGFHYLSGNQI
jgi:hypothetical protein